MANASILLNGKYDYRFPKQPPKEEIRFSELSKKDQYWRRYEIPNEEEWLELESHQQLKIIQEDLQRRVKGCWFMNNGVATYLTGHNYFYLQWFKIEGKGYPSFRKYQWELYLFIDFVEKDNKCKGACISKIRQAGITTVFAARNLNIAMTKREVKITLQNKKSDEAISVNFASIAFAFNKMPQHTIVDERIVIDKKTGLKKSEYVEIPAFYPANSKILLGEGVLSFGAQYERSTGTEAQAKRNRLKKKEDNPDTLIECVATEVSANDGRVLYSADMDEYLKYPVGISTDLCLTKTLPAIGHRYGKVMMYSTSDEKDTKNFREGRKIYMDSDYLGDYRKEHGKTKSELYSYFISGKYALESTEKGVTYFDVYGNCDESAAVAEIKAKRNAVENEPQKLQGVKRQFPIYEEEAFALGGTGACYDIPHLLEAEAIAELEINRTRYTDEDCCLIGRLEWIKGKYEPQGGVKFVADSEGLWEMNLMPPPQFKNKVKMVDGLLSPDEFTSGVTTIDPTSFTDQVANGEGSKNAVVSGYTFDDRLPKGGNMPYLNYLGRPATTDMFKDEAKKVMVYTGSLCYIERNKEWLLKELIAEGWGLFLITYEPETGHFRRWKRGETMAGGATGKPLIEAYVRATEAYLRYPVKEDGETIDYCLLLRSLRIIEQLKEFDPNDTKRFDLAVAFGFWCMVTRGFQKIKNVDTLEEMHGFIRAFFSN